MATVSKFTHQIVEKINNRFLRYRVADPNAPGCKYVEIDPDKIIGFMPNGKYEGDKDGPRSEMMLDRVSITVFGDSRILADMTHNMMLTEVEQFYVDEDKDNLSPTVDDLENEMKDLDDVVLEVSDPKKS